MIIGSTILFRRNRKIKRWKRWTYMLAYMLGSDFIVSVKPY